MNSGVQRTNAAEIKMSDSEGGHAKSEKDRESYSVRMARICLSRILSSTPMGGRTSLPWTMAPRIQILPGRLVVLSGS